jgi:hypothetical protein
MSSTAFCERSRYQTCLMAMVWVASRCRTMIERLMVDGNTANPDAGSMFRLQVFIK